MGVQSNIRPQSKAKPKIDLGLLSAIAKKQAVIDTRYQQDIYPVYAFGDRRRRAMAWIEREMVEALYNSGDLKSVGRGYQLCYNSEKRLLAGQWSFGQPSRATEDSVIYVPAKVQRNVSKRSGGNVLQRLTNSRDSRGEPFLKAYEIEAGRLFQRDYHRVYGAGLSSQSYDVPQVDRSRSNVSETRIAAQIDNSAAFQAAKASLGEGLTVAAMVICGDDKSLEQLEREQDWSHNSGKTILKLALQALSEHYGTKPGRRH